jgi:hypothetical protein
VVEARAVKPSAKAKQRTLVRRRPVIGTLATWKIARVTEFAFFASFHTVNRFTVRAAAGLLLLGVRHGSCEVIILLRQGKEGRNLKGKVKITLLGEAEVDCARGIVSLIGVKRLSCIGRCDGWNGWLAQLRGCDSSRDESGQRSRVCRRGFPDGDVYLVFGPVAEQWTLSNMPEAHQAHFCM